MRQGQWGRVEAPLSGHFAAQFAMSALPPKADMCSALGDVRFVPIADICSALAHVRFVPIADMCGATRNVR